MPRLAYCTNVARAPSPDAIVASLHGLWREVRENAGLESLGLGLWFPAPVAAALAGDAGEQDRLQDALAANGLTCETLNGFPANEFHADVVKDAVYRPDWLTDERRVYTLDLARIAAALVGDGGDITISTLPLGFPKWSDSARRRAAARLAGVAIELHRLREETGATIRLALEPEPCCALERTREVLTFFRDHMRPAFDTVAQVTRGMDGSELLARHVGVCLDLCHASVAHEDPVVAFWRYRESDIPVHKVQVSAALVSPDPSDPAQREALARFVEARWLHQTGVAGGDVVLDLSMALATESLAERGPWHVHFHVPLNRAEVGGLPTTRETVSRFLRHIRTVDDPPILELETYTWSVVPDASSDLAANIADEIAWVRATLEDPPTKEAE